MLGRTQVDLVVLAQPGGCSGFGSAGVAGCAGVVSAESFIIPTILVVIIAIVQYIANGNHFRNTIVRIVFKLLVDELLLLCRRRFPRPLR